VVVRVADRALAIPVEHVIETMRPLPIISEPAPAPYALGHARIRGAPCPVIDLARRLGLTDDAPASRFIVVRGDHGAVALQVSAVVGIAALGDGPPISIPSSTNERFTDDGLDRVWRDARWARSGLHGAAGAAEPHAVP
jgi:chemotaxis signal transduction protein